MKMSGLIGLALAAMLATGTAGAGETVIARDVLGPEGPLVVDHVP